MSTPTPEQRKRFVADLFDRLAETYDDVGVDYFQVFARRLVDLAGITTGERVLDAGCGRGAATFAAAEAVGPTGSITAVDIAPGMVERTAADAKARGLDQVTVLVGDAEDPDVTGPYDAILSALVVFFLPDPLAALRHYRALLRDGGRLALTTFPPQPDGPWQTAASRLESYLPGRTTKPDTGPLAGPEHLANTLRDNGFGPVTQTTEPHDVMFDDLDHWWRWAWSQGQRAALERVPPGELDALRAELYDLLRPQLRPDGTLPLRQYVTYTVATAG